MSLEITTTEDFSTSMTFFSSYYIRDALFPQTGSIIIFECKVSVEGRRSKIAVFEKMMMTPSMM